MGAEEMTNSSPTTRGITMDAEQVQKTKDELRDDAQDRVVETLATVMSPGSIEEWLAKPCRFLDDRKPEDELWDDPEGTVKAAEFEAMRIEGDLDRG